MRHTRLLIALIAGILLGSVASVSLGAENGWIVYQPGKGACTIKLPANPEYQTNIVDAMTTHVYTAKDTTKSPALVYSIGYGDYPKAKLAEKDGAKKLLDADRDNFIKTVNGKLLAEKTISKDNYPGRAVLLSGEDAKAHYLLREYLVENRIFQLVVCVPASTDDPDATRFFDSFQLPGK